MGFRGNAAWDLRCSFCRSCVPMPPVAPRRLTSFGADTRNDCLPAASAPVIAVGYIGPIRRFDNRLPLMSCSSHYSEKFEVLGLPQLWEEAAGRADFHLSEPDSVSYKTDMGERWRGLLPATQRSYMVVAVKKAEGQLRRNSSRRISSAEAYVMLLNNVFELLWVIPSKRSSMASRRPSPETIARVARRSTFTRLPAVAEDEEEDANGVSLSPAWRCSSMGVVRPLTRLENALGSVEEREEDSSGLEDSDSCNSDWSMHS